MPPLPERPGAKIRPCPPLEPSPAGFIAYSRIASSTRSGLLWSAPSGSSGQAIDPARPGYISFETGWDSGWVDAAIPAITEWMRLKGPARRARLRGFGEAQMRETLRSLGKHSWDLESYLDGVSKEEVLAVMATSGLAFPSTSSTGSETDDFVLALARWFKSDYMTWIDPVPCPACQGPTKGTGSTNPTEAERSEGGGRVELHQCIRGGCGATRRFVRYGQIRPLMRTREGRCGEWAHLFYAFLRVAGVEARYIWNSEDHVWAEYWSPAKEHWVHVDPCEAAVGKPFLYEKGWGKKQSYCLAFGPRGAEDVTAVYVVDQAGCELRRQKKGWRERILAVALEQHTISLQAQRPQAELERWDYMIRKQHEWKSDVKRRLAEAEEEEMGGRVSGLEDWRKMRDEMGSDKVPRPSFSVTKLLHDLKSSDVYLFGDAVRAGSGVVLTTRSSQASGVFADVRIAQTTSFRATVTFRMFAPPVAGEADGMAIVFSRDRKLGLGGYGLGYSGLGGKGDFAVEIDTYRTQDHADDPPAPHISVHSPPDAHHRNSIACTKPGQVPFLSDGRLWTLELVYDGSSRQLVGWMKGKDDASKEGKVDEIGLWEVSVPPGEGPGGDWYVGVTGSCGGLWQKQEVLEWKIDEVVLSKAASDTEQI